MLSQNQVTASHKDQRRQQLINATIKTISHYGLSKTTVSKVTKNANLSAGIVGFYFNSKEQLLIGTLESINEELRREANRVLESYSDPRGALEALIDVYFEPELCNVDKIAVWYAFSSESTARKEYMEICGEHYAVFHQTLLDLTRRLCAQTSINPDNAEAISRGLDGIIDGYWQDYLYQPEDFDREVAKKTCRDYLNTIFPIQLDSVMATVSSTQEKADASQEQSDCLPTWTYFDSEFLDLEIQQLFRKNWLLVGHINDMPNPRDYLTLDAIGERAMVIRGNDNQIRAFHNVCRHRGAKLFDSPSGQCAHALTCPFHGWTYQLDGKLIGVPAENTFDNLDKTKRGLVPLDMEIWMGFIFIRFVKQGQSLAEQMQAVAHRFEPYKVAEMVPLANTKFHEVVPYNWKVVHDIDNEGYHVPIGHPSLQQLYGKSYKDFTEDGHSLSTATINEKPGKLWSVKNYQNLLPKFDHLPEENQKLWLYGNIFPSMVLGFYPDCMEFYMTIPVSTDKTILRGGSYSLPDSRRGMDAVRYLNRRINDTTSAEDESYVKWLQEGMNSSAFPEPKLSSIEYGVREFHHQIQNILPVGKLKHHPGKGLVSQTNASLTG